MNIYKSLFAIFHLLIITSLVLSINGCGYKGAPYYSEAPPAEDENVKFILKKKEFNQDNNESCTEK